MGKGGGAGFCTGQHLVDTAAELGGMGHWKGKILGGIGGRNRFEHQLYARPQYGMLSFIDL